MVSLKEANFKGMAMKDEIKTKRQLIRELTELRKEADEFSAAIDQWMKADDTLQESDER